MKHSIARTFYKLILFLCIVPSYTYAQTSSFTYQGKLNDGGAPANMNYDMQFRLFDDLGAGDQIGTTQTISNVQAIAGIFTVQLDFGAAAFSGEDRFIEISISLAGVNTFTTLAPRQKLTSAPYSVQSLNATTADSAIDSLNLGGLAASEYVQANDSRLSDARIPLPGSGDYVQNTGTEQPGVGFNIGGTGTANILNAATQFDLGGSRILGTSGTNNLFVGIGAGEANTTGVANSFFGRNAGAGNTEGFNNSFFGNSAGTNTTTGHSNAFFGAQAGVQNSTGAVNSFFGNGAGFNNTTGSFNSFFGQNAGSSNSIGDSNSFFGVTAGSISTGSSNSFFGSSSGRLNTTGSFNSFFGRSAGFNNTAGIRNSFFGIEAGLSNTTGNNLTMIGSGANVGAADLSFATAVGSGAVVPTSDTVMLGKVAGTYNGVARPADIVQIPGALSVSGTAGANIFNANTWYEINGFRVLGVLGDGNFVAGANTGINITTGRFNAFFGNGAGFVNNIGEQNTFIGESAGASNTRGIFNTFVGRAAGGLNTIGNNNIFIGPGTGNPTGTIVNNSIAIGVNNVVSTSDTIKLGTGSHTRMIVQAGQADGVSPALEVASSGIGGSVIANNLYIRQFNELGSPAHLCFRVSAIGVPANVVTTCTSPFSSSVKKEDFQPFSAGLDIVRRLNPVSFRWKNGGTEAIGLNAEEVAEVAPEFVTRNAKGEIEDVRENSLSVVFINAIKEQQKQIEEQAARIKQQQQQIEALKLLVCVANREAEVCREETK
jgi:hypothetical protein